MTFKVYNGPRIEVIYGDVVVGDSPPLCSTPNCIWPISEYQSDRLCGWCVHKYITTYDRENQCEYGSET
jgi:hypothetical protein